MKKAELVFIPVPGAGHLVSTVEFAKRLIARDDRLSVTILLIKPPFGPPLDSYTNSLPQSTRIQLVDLPPVDPPDCDPFKSIEHFIRLYVENYVPHVKAVLTDLIASRSSSGDSVRLAGLVVDFFCLSMIDVGNELGLPSYLFLTSGASFLGFMLYLPTRHSQINSEFEYSDAEFTIPSFANSVPSKVLPSAVFNKDGGYTAFIKLAQRFRDTKGIIVNTFAELEPYAVNSLSDGQTPTVYTVGPVLDINGQTHPGLDRAQRDKIMKWLDDQPPSSVVFLCFGSMGSFGAPQVREIAFALERSGHRFLYSMRQPPSEAKSTPEDVLPEGFLERTTEIGLICGWAPQAEVLAHRAVGGFVSHCGWNSILESLWHGVPVVTWPLYAEQQMNAFSMVKELGLAVELRLDSMSGGEVVAAEEIEKAIRRVMEGESEARRKVREIGEKSRRALMDGGSSLVSLGQLIEDVTGESD